MKNLMTTCYRFVYVCILAELLGTISCIQSNKEGCKKAKKLDIKSYHTDFTETLNKEIIKREILSKIGYENRPKLTSPIKRSSACSIINSVADNNTVSKPPNGSYFAEIQEIISLSEPSDNFHNENIIQFKLQNSDNQGRHLEVKSANVLVKVKYKKRRKRKDKKRITRGKSRRPKAKRRSRIRKIAIILSTIDTNGRPVKPPVSTVQADVRRTNWFNLGIPKDEVEKAMNTSDRLLRFHVRCKGCYRGASLVLVHGRKRRKNGKRRLKEKYKTFVKTSKKTVRSMRTSRRGRTKTISKRRPFLILHTRVQTFIRPKRSAPDCVGEGDSMCCKSNFVFDFDEVGWGDWVISPRYFVTGFCSGSCSLMPSGGRLMTTLASVGNTQTCNATRHSPLQMTYYDDNETILTSSLPNMITEECGCRDT